MRAFYLDNAETLTLRDAPPPVAGEGEVTLRVHTVGICGSDIEYYRHFRIGSFVPRGPLVLGHEISGEVAAHGPGTDTTSAPAIGSRVAIDPSMPCRRCTYCRAGRHNLCTNMRFIGTAATVPHISGGLGEYVVVPAGNCYHVPDHVSWGEAACLEPLAVAVHAALRPGSVAGSRVLVTGGGTIGQFVALVARALGSARVTVSDLQAFRREFARNQGADDVFDPSDPHDVERARTTSGGFDIIFEASGAPSAVRGNLEIVERGGTIVQIGSIQRDVELPANHIMAKELRVLGSFRYGEVYPTAMNLLARRQVDVRPLISRTFSFGETPEAFGLAAERAETVKVQIAMA
ncbi:MAG: NAD(P)-dependent alcohol dehydrogenase [Spirochaetota bacterium]